MIPREHHKLVRQTPLIGAWLEEYLRVGDNLDSMSDAMMPKLERTIADAYNGELYLLQGTPLLQTPANPS